MVDRVCVCVCVCVCVAGPPCFTHTVPLASVRSGYQHIYFNSSEYDVLQTPPSLFMHVMVSVSAGKLASNSPPLPLQLKGGDVGEPRTAAGRDMGAEKPNLLFVNLLVEENMHMKSAMLHLAEVIDRNRPSYVLPHSSSLTIASDG